MEPTRRTHQLSRDEGVISRKVPKAGESAQQSGTQAGRQAGWQSSLRVDGLSHFRRPCWNAHNSFKAAGVGGLTLVGCAARFFHVIEIACRRSATLAGSFSVCVLCLLL